MRLNVSTTLATQLNQIFRQGSLILTSILLVKTGLSTTEIGVYETLNYLGTTLTFFWLNGLLQSFLVRYPSVDNAQKKEFLFNIFLIFNIINIFIILISFLFKKQFLVFLTGNPSLSYFELYLVYLLINIPTFLIEYIWIVENRPLSIIALSFFTYVVLPIAIVLPLFFGFTLAVSFKILIALSSIRFFILIKNTIYNSFKINLKLINDLLKLSTPLVLYALLAGFVTSFSGWLVNWFYDGNLSVFAIYRYGAREFPLVLAMTTGLSNAIVPHLASQHGISTEGVAALREKSLQLWHWLYPISIALMLSSKWVFKYVFSQDFEASAPVFNIFLLLLLSRALFPQSVLLALQNTRAMLKISVIETLSILFLSFILIQIYGYKGVAWAIVLGYFLEKVLIIFYLKRKYNIDFQSYTNVKLYFLYSSVLIISFYIASF